MISLNSLAAFTQEVTRSSGIQPTRGSSQGFGADATKPSASASPSSNSPQRTLDMVPPQPLSPLPRGSLLDLRV